MSVAERMAVMRDGTVHQIGTPTELYDEPDDEFVASFIGSPTMNYQSGSVADGHLSLGPFEYDLSALGTDLGKNEYQVGVRPQDVRIARGTGADGTEATVQVTEPLGAETIVDLLIDEEEWRAVSDDLWVQQELDIGDSVEVSIDANDLYLIDPDTGTVVRTPERSG